MRVIAAQLDPTIGDLQGNVDQIVRVLDKAREKKADLVVFPEMAICGYPPEDLLLHASFVEAVEKSLERVVRASSQLMVVVGLVRRNRSLGEKPLFNTAAIVHDGKLLGFYDKCLLPTYDVFDERRYFEPGTAMSTWDLKGKKIAVTICEDLWQHAGYVDFSRYPRDPVIDLIPCKPDLVLNISASPYHFKKTDIRLKVCTKAAKTLHCPLISCYQVGGNDQLVFDGYSMYVDKEGELAQVALGFEEDEMVIDLEAPTSPCPFSYDPLKDLYAALVLGVRDYFHKLGFKKGVLGLSGGIDSALVACISADALGKENVLGISMPSRYSSPSSQQDAKALAEHLGIELKTIPIETVFTEYLNLFQPYFQEPEPGVTEENLQARIRGMILMAISNQFGYVVLSTGNKSEMAMGYCTLYGDMCGGLGVISDVSKTHVYALADWVNREKEIIPWSTIRKPPSAELRPNQKDTDTLPDYAIVDAVLQDYVENFLSPEEIAKKHDLPFELVLDLVRRIHRAEYKRRQAPPGIRVTKKSFRVGRRLPIVQRWVV